MKLSDREIREHLDKKNILISPAVDPAWIGPVSVDLSLGDTFLTFRHSSVPLIDLGTTKGKLREIADDLMQTIVVEDGQAFYLQPSEFALGATRESIELPNDIAGWLDGRSSLARVGLLVHATAHTLEPGWRGNITLEFFNAGKVPLALRPGIRICAVSFDLLTSSVINPYSSKPGAKYLNQHGPIQTRIDKEHR